jgi:glycosyltransferase involved in cell wall biosynthesis
VEDEVTGLLVERGNVDALSRAMQSLMQDHARTDAMGRAGRARAERVFDARTVAQETLAAMGLG